MRDGRRLGPPAARPPRRPRARTVRGRRSRVVLPYARRVPGVPVGGRSGRVPGAESIRRGRRRRLPGGQRREPAHRSAVQGRLRTAAGTEHPLRGGAALQDAVAARAGADQRPGRGPRAGLSGVIGRRPGCRGRGRPAGYAARPDHSYDEGSVRPSAEGAALASLGESEYAALASCATGMTAACQLRAFSARDAPARLVPGDTLMAASRCRPLDHDTYAKAQDCAHFQPEGQ